MANKVKIRAFRALDYPDVCERYIEGHSRILTSVGVEQVTSSYDNWMENPAAYVVLCESTDGKKVFGGARIHVAGGSQNLPIVDATIDMDSTVQSHVERYHEVGTGEFCGLWNSLEVAGFGIGAIYLIRSSVAIIPQLKLNTMFALCSPYTARIASNYGFRKYTEVGNEGTFYYPKIDLLATAVFLPDSKKLEHASENERDRILDLRTNPNQVLKESNRGREIEIEYSLEIENVDTSVYA